MPNEFKIRGGLKLPGRKHLSLQTPIHPASIPHEVVLPLDQHVGSPANPCVKVGENVRVGQVVAKPSDAFSCHVHASVSGTVVAIEVRPAPRRIGSGALSIVIASDGQDSWDDSLRALPDYRELTPDELRAHLAKGGLVGLGGAAFPTATKLDVGARAHVRSLILNGAESEPYITCDQALMYERPADVLAGAQILIHAVQAERCIIAIEDDKPEAQPMLQLSLAELKDERIVITAIPSVYPAGWEGQLITSLLGVEVPRGALPADVGVVCQNVSTAAAVATWVLRGEPLIRRIVTVTGGGVHQPRNLEARIGASVANLIEDCGGYEEGVVALVLGGTMMGIAVPNDKVPLLKSTNCVFAALPSELQPRHTLPCIRCGDCSLVCPAGLLPQQLHWHARNDNDKALIDLGLWDCVECGCCDYVCPSQIPLAEQFRDAKQRLTSY